MKKTFGFIILILSSFVLCGQSWISSNILYSGDNISIITSASGPTNNTVVLGYFTDSISGTPDFQLNSYGGSDYFVANFDSELNLIWIKQIGSDVNVYIDGGVAIADDGSVFVTGGFRNYLKYTPSDSIESTHLMDMFLIKYDPNGQAIWCRNIGSGAGPQLPNVLKVDNAGDLLITGWFRDSISFNESLTLYNTNTITDYFYGKFSPLNGDPIWVKQINGINNSLS